MSSLVRPTSVPAGAEADASSFGDVETSDEPGIRQRIRSRLQACRSVCSCPSGIPI
jgi:hypothetical protein